jgi:hypothetical protein
MIAARIMYGQTLFFDYFTVQSALGNSTDGKTLEQKSTRAKTLQQICIV